MSDNQQQQKGTNVQVAVRCRPLNGEERRAGQPTVLSCEPENKAVKVAYGALGKKTQKTYTFDKVFGTYSTQEEVFEGVVRPIVDETLAGFNCTIFAYGQTGTGKTHTMEGDINSHEHAGIVPRAVKAILEQLEQSGAEFTIRVSFLELYNEELQDLLQENQEEKGKLRLCEDVKRGVVCQNLEEITVLNVTDIFDILHRGIKQRQTAETLCNKNSSRSHTIFTMKIMIKETNVEGEEVVRHGQLNLVDLAGSECVGRSGAKNARAREAGNINQSLLTLGRVITALVDHHSHIPYRDSKLTRILQESLGGKAKTCIIATLSPSQLCVEETLSTLDYAHRAKNIKNTPQVNQRMTKKVVLKEYCAEIESLRAQLQITREKNGVYVDPVQFEAMESRLASQESQLNECEAALKVKMEEVKAIRSERDELLGSLHDSREQLEAVNARLEAKEAELEQAMMDIRNLQIEWKAAEGVITEQQTTEAQLLSHGQELQSTITEHRDEISRLFDKIGQHKDLESTRLASVRSFLAALSASQTTLTKGVDKMTEQSKKHSQDLCAGMSETLTRSKDMCSVLSTSINDALGAMIGDSAMAKDAMTNSCTNLTNHLNNTQESVINTLQTLQGALGEWLQDVEKSMAATKNVLEIQQTQIDRLHASIAESQSSHEQIIKSFIDQQAVYSQQAQQDADSLRASVVDRLREYQAEQSRAAKDQTEMLRSQAQEMEKRMHSMIQDMMASHQQSISKSLQSTETFVTETTATHTSGIDMIVKSVSDMQNNCQDTARDVRSTLRSNCQQQNDLVESIANEKAKATTNVNGVHGATGHKRKYLEDTLTDVSDTVTVSVKKACNEVDETSAMAGKVLVDIKCAAEKMESSAGSCMSSFVSFIENQGEDLNKELNVHFDSLHSFFSTQQDGLAEAGHLSSEYALRSEMEVMATTGNTPQKKAYVSLSSLPTTRDHEIIKSEIRKLEMPMEDEDAMEEETEDKIEAHCGVPADDEEGLENCDPQRISRDFSRSSDSVEDSKIRLKRGSSVTRRRGTSSSIDI